MAVYGIYGFSRPNPDSLPLPIDTAHELYVAARELLRRAAIGGRPIRLLGLGVEGLEPAADPLQLGFDGTGWDDLERAIDRVRHRFGTDAVSPARLADRGE